MFSRFREWMIYKLYASIFPSLYNGLIAFLYILLSSLEYPFLFQKSFFVRRRKNLSLFFNMQIKKSFSMSSRTGRDLQRYNHGCRQVVGCVFIYLFLLIICISNNVFEGKYENCLWYIPLKYFEFVNYCDLYYFLHSFKYIYLISITQKSYIHIHDQN